MCPPTLKNPLKLIIRCNKEIIFVLKGNIGLRIYLCFGVLGVRGMIVFEESKPATLTELNLSLPSISNFARFKLLEISIFLTRFWCCQEKVSTLEITSSRRSKHCLKSGAVEATLGRF